MIDLPPGTPTFWEAPAAWCRCIWIGPGRGWVDPVKEAQAADIRMQTGLSTLQDEAAEQGRDWEELLDQRERELAELERRGLTMVEANYDGVSTQEEDPDSRPGEPPKSENAPLAIRLRRLERIRDRAEARAKGKAA